MKIERLSNFKGLGGKVMIINRQVILNLCYGIILIGLLSGCAMSQKERLANSSTDYNLVVEKAQNEMLLMNIVRASKRHPMYFTALSQVRGSISYGFQTGSITIPFGQIGTGLNGAYSFAPSISHTNNPSFDLAVLDNEKFTRGIMTPVPLGTFYYYWQQGWPKEMLMLLFFERIEPANESLEPLDNYPGDSEKFKQFQDRIQKIVKLGCKLKLKDETELFGPKISIKTAKDLKLLIEAQKAELIISAIDGKDKKIEGYQLKKVKQKYIDIQCLSKNENSSGIKFQIVSGHDSSALSKNKELKNTIYLRSPEAILYYLGEIVRAQTDPNPDIGTLIDCSKPNLFVVDKSSDADGKNYSVAIDYEGYKYGIRKDSPADSDIKCPDRSMQVLSLISQLIGLHKSVEQMPVTGTVTVIGR